jgi:divalent metal cation (Fe/Co/Zn/Cd) transporter
MRPLIATQIGKTRVYFLHRNSSLALSDLLVFFSFLMILAVQSILFNFFPLKTIAGFIIRLFVAFAAVRLVKDFPRIYINEVFSKLKAAN